LNLLVFFIFCKEAQILQFLWKKLRRKKNYLIFNKIFIIIKKIIFLKKVKIFLDNRIKKKMALNPPLTATGNPLRIDGEHFILFREHMEIEVKIPTIGKKSAKGKVIILI
jgi:hypothetical protein